jgi:MFS family permease
MTDAGSARRGVTPPVTMRAMEIATASRRSGIGGLLRLPAFRAVLVANLLSAIAFGTSRFVFIWLVGELTDWNPATAILGVVIGLPPLMLSAWAGSLADQLSPRRLGMGLFATSSALFALIGMLVAADAMTVPLAMIAGFVAISGPAMLIPLPQALVPTVTPPGQLMQAVALQNLSMMMSMIGGIFLGGAVMQLFGTAAGFWLLAAASGLGCLAMANRELPEHLSTEGATRGSVRDGARVALGTEPLRSLLSITAVMGVAIATSALLLPEFARDVLDKDSLAASGLNVMMSIGLMVTSLLIATRWTPRRPGLVLAIFAAVPIGGGLVAIGLSGTYVATALCCFGWGMSGGITMTLLRTLTQQHTPPELMGRVMGLVAMAQNGAFPLTAIMLFALVAWIGVAGAMVATGFICSALMSLVVIRPVVRRL